jgi:choline dehydrogenase-like flavoprotein
MKVSLTKRTGGTAGSVVASRLIEIMNFQVLVIEAGPS